MPELIWGIDLGGTKIEGIVAQSNNLLEPVARLRIPTEAQHGYEHIVSRIAELVRQLEAGAGIECKRLGMSTPGCSEPATGLMKNCNTTALNGHPLVSDVSMALNGIQVLAANDANCFAVSEAHFGAAQGADSVFGVILGTGVGGSMVVNGMALYGLHGIAGEWGHNVLDPHGDPCYCGKRGCVEQVISGPALEKYYYSLSGNKLKLEEIAALASGREPGVQPARQTIDRLCRYLGQALAVIINIIDPEAIVLGGGVSNVPQIYSTWPEYALPWVFNSTVRTPLLRHKLGDSAGVFGAALLAQGC